MKADGSNRTRLTTTSGRYFSPVFSPDGQKIAFYSDESNALYLMNRDGTDGPKLIWKSEPGSSPGLLQGRLSFSPDGRKIAFAANSDYKGNRGRSVGPISIYSINIDGTGLKRLTNTYTNDLDPCFSPDGHKIVFSSGDASYSYLHMMNADGTERIVINPFPDAERHGQHEPYFSPNGREIVFVRGSNEAKEIYVVDSNGQNPRRLTRNQSTDSEPVWGR